MPKKGDRTPDAVRVARTYPEGLSEVKRHVALKERFAKLMGVRRVFSSQEGTMETLIVPMPENFSRPLPTRFFEQGHDLEGQDRYDWFVVRQDGDGEWQHLIEAEGEPDELAEVKFGYLKPEAQEQNLVGVGADELESSLEARIKARRGAEDFHGRLAALGLKAPQAASQAAKKKHAEEDLPGSSDMTRKLPK